MKLASLLVTLLAGCAASRSPAACPSTTATAASSTTAPTVAGFDPALAKRLGADDYGMRKYVLAFLKAGPKRDQPPEEAKALMTAHLDNIGRLAKAGKLVLAGPFMDDGAMRGIYVFAVETIEEAAALTATDPAIEAGRLEMELHPWYGSAALVDLNAIHERIQAKQM